MALHLKKKQRTEIIRFVEYSVSGGAYFWSGYLMFAICDKGLHMSLWWAKLTANIFGVTINFLLTRFWVFSGKNNKKNLPTVTGRYLALTGVNFLIDYLIVKGLLVSIGLSPYLGQFVSSGFFTVWNYLWYKFWVFARPRQPVRRSPIRTHHKLVPRKARA